MKSYEVRNEMERKIRWLGYEVSKYTNFLNNLLRDYENFEQHYELEKSEFQKAIKGRQEDVDKLTLLLDAAQTELATFNTSKVKVVDLPKAEISNGNGKITCDICGRTYSPQGYPKHREACAERQDKLRELERLEQLRKELEKEDEGVE